MFLPKPIPSEIEEFGSLYRMYTGNSLSYNEAEVMLTAILQFYFLIGGHEVYERRKKAGLVRQARAAHSPNDQPDRSNSPVADAAGHRT